MAKFLSNKKNFSLIIIIIKLLFCENTIERIAIDFDTYNLIDHQNIYSNFICATGTLTPQKFFYILEEQGCFLVFHLFPVFCELRHTSYYCWCSVEKYNIQGERNRQIEQYIKCNHGFFVPFQPFRSQIPLKCICKWLCVASQKIAAITITFLNFFFVMLKSRFLNLINTHKLKLYQVTKKKRLVKAKVAQLESKKQLVSG
ncbi:hypothetical protein EDEG_03997 [Edhazardia aedis USNM 41457]|uniref:Uncharacterized protein n=1 Tax=Edhazardia aedis (strain USNM 41457) TaxID=1003232 RepID=J8ZNV9_EDHAE|nr:hypothetical protein EDEG_03997 [Edhazardia aedis USNM 41457]|eukprot:EJW01378.1 hypothetical protein EDEG_03997 [Edhazardia aedis USNM 41457]